MQEFTSEQWIQIAIANAYGLDKESWDTRIAWTKEHKDTLTEMIETAKEPFLFIKACNALQDFEEGNPSGFVMSLDASASGLQIMSLLVNDEVGAKETNVISTGFREDIYSKIHKDMVEAFPSFKLSVKDLKYVIMPVFYGSTRKPKEVFNDAEYEYFYTLLSKYLKGATEVLEDIQSCWDSNTLVHTFTLPDGHTAYIPVITTEEHRVEIDELNHASFTYISKVVKKSDSGISLAANVIHAIDGFIVREVVKELDVKGIECLTIHDSFWVRPKHVSDLRKAYNSVLCFISDNPVLENILNELTGVKGEVIKYKESLSSDIMNNNYALS